MKSILHNASKANIMDGPFPHLVIRNALESDLYRELAREFPSANILRNGRRLSSNEYCHYHARDILANPRISPLWREFTAYHVSPQFYTEVVSLFGDRIRALNPDLAEKLGKKLEDLETSIRYQEDFRDIALECQLTYCSPVTRPSRSAEPHVDREVALYAGLLYFRLDDDDSTGGDLEFYRFNSSHREYDEKRQVPAKSVERVKTIEYQKNTLVFFLHLPESVHGVSMRSVTNCPRLHINFVGEFQMKVFDLSNYRRR